MPEGSGEKFLSQKYRELHKTKEVKHEQKRKKRAGEKVTQKPAEKIGDFMKVLEKTHLSHRDDPRVMDRIKKHYHKEHVIKPKNIPQSYWNTQAKIMINEGRGGDLDMAGIEKKTYKDKKGKEVTDYIFPDNLRDQNAEVIISDQASTLDNWTDYFTSPDADYYPMWAKYWSFNNMLKLSTYDKEKKRFGKRRKDTVAPFPDLNREALAYVVDAITKKANKEHIPATDDNPEFKKILQTESFSKLYAYAIEKVTPAEEHELKNTAGKWIKYDQNSDHMPLVESLQGHGTGWCTAGEETAKAQLQGGDFQVYYSNDQQGTPNVPRIAIRMDQGRIGEVRGIAPDQNLDPYIADVADQELDKFPDGKQYKQKVADMKQLTEIDKRHQASGELTKEDLKFLYEIDDKIEGFGYDKDPRIEEILEGRDIKTDISMATGFSRKQISINTSEAMSGNIEVHYGNLDLGGQLFAHELKFPNIVIGNINLRFLKSARGLKLPESVRGDIDLGFLRTAEGLNLPRNIGGNINLMALKKVDGLVFPKNMQGGISLRSLTSAKSLTLPDNIGKYLDLRRLTIAEELTLPSNVGGNLNLSKLASVKELTLPSNVGGNLDLRSLIITKGLTLSDNVGGKIMLNNIHPNEIEELRKKYPDLRI